MRFEDVLSQKAAEYAKLEPDELELQLGLQLQQLESDLTSDALTAAVPTDPAIDRGRTMSVEDAGVVRRIARRFIERFKAALYRVICDETDPDNAKVRGALQLGADHLAAALAVLLTATFGWLPGICVVAAAWLAKTIFAEGHGAVCDVWKEQLGY